MRRSHKLPWAKLLAFAIWLGLPAMPAFAQKRVLTYPEVFGDHPLPLYQPLPMVSSWLTNDSFVLTGNGPGQLLGRLSNKTLQAYTGDVNATLNQTAKEPLPPTNSSNFTVSPNGKLAAYTLNNNLYLFNIISGKTVQLTHDGSDVVLNGYSSWLYHEEVLGSYNKHRAFWWSNDSKKLAFMRFDDSGVGTFPIYASAGQYGYIIKQHFPKVGTPNPKVKIGLVDADSATLTWAHFDQNNDQYFRTPYFTPGNKLWVQWVNRRQDSLKVFEIDNASGSKKLIYTEHQKTWVTQNDGIYFTEGRNMFINRSDKTGWSHFYLYDANGHFKNAITSGNYNVAYVVKFIAATNTIYFVARKESSTRQDLYSISLNGKGLKRITQGQSSYTNISIAPDARHFIASYGNIKTPTVMAAFDMAGNKVMDIASVKTQAFDQLRLPRKELLTVKSRDGYRLPVIITYPLNFDSTKRYPVVLSVYGGPYSMSVNDSWNLPPVDMWWAQEGVIQVTADNRASGHFGKAGMNDIYGRLGLHEIEDFMDVGTWLKSQQWVKPDKLCITGFSFGGYMTCMALTYGAAVFDYGIAYWPSTNFTLYDTYYTERYMGAPGSNAAGYKATAVATYAGRYKGLLRLVHGTADDNSHLQQTLQLADTLQNLNKRFEFMLYPGEGHGLTGAKWKHNKTQTYRFYYENLLVTKLPPQFEK